MRNMLKVQSTKMSSHRSICNVNKIWSTQLSNHMCKFQFTEMPAHVCKCVHQISPMKCLRKCVTCEILILLKISTYMCVILSLLQCLHKCVMHVKLSLLSTCMCNVCNI